MPNHHSTTNRPYASESKDIDRCAEAFEDALQRGRQRSLDEFLSAGPVASIVLAKLVHIELAFRLRRGESARVEEYLARYPQLVEVPAVVVDLAVAEFTLRHGREATLDRDSFLARFPAHRDALAVRLSTCTPNGPGTSANHGNSSVPDGNVTAPMPFEPEADVALPHVPGYEILSELGRGGMGVVYKARHIALNRVVALKMLHAARRTDAEQRARFRVEVETVAHLQHPHIVQVYDVGEHEGRPFFTMEFLGGASLADGCQGQPQPPNTAAELIETLARAMHAVHVQGIVHRDLKPSNVVRAADDRPKITDFGLARPSSSDLTSTGAMLGTPSYMAPEQAAGKTHAIGPAADIYALGALLYELLTGRPPFRGLTPLDTLDQVRTQEPVPPRRLQPKVPRDLETICLKCLHKEAAQRYASAQELAEDCARFQKGEPIHARPLGQAARAWRWCRRQPTLAALAALSVGFVALLLGGGFWYSARLGAAKGEADAATLRAATAEKESAAARELADTREYFALLGRARERALRHRNGWTAASAEDLRRAAALPPGAEGLAELRTELAHCLGSIDLRESGRVATGLTAYALEFDPRGRWLALGQSKAQAWATCSVLLADAASGQTVYSLSFAPSFSWQLANKVQDGARCLAFSPDGRWLVLGTRSGMLHRWDLNANPPRIESWQGHGKEVVRVCFSPDGTSLFSLAQDLCLRRWDAADGWQKRAQFTCPSQLVGLAVSPQAEWIACSGGDRLYFLTLDTLLPARPPVMLPGLVHFALDPAGRILATHSERTIHILDATGRVVCALRAPDGETSHEGRITSLAFSPDGTLLASSSEENHEVRLWDLASGRLVADWNVAGGRAQAAFRPDGRALAVIADPGAVLYALGGLDVQAPLALHAGAVRAIALHPRGTALACLADTIHGGTPSWELDGWPLRVGLSRPSFTRRCLRRRPASLAFAPDGRCLLHTDGDGISRWDLTTTADTRIPLRGPADRLRLARDGRMWVVAGDEVRAWDLPGQKPVAHWSNRISEVLTGLGGIKDLATGQRWVVVAGRDGFARLLRAADAGLATSRRCSNCPLSAAALNASETVAAVASEQGEIILLEVPSGAVLARLPAHTDGVTSLVFAGDTLLVSGSRDRTVRLTAWDSRVARALFTLRLGGSVVQICLTPDNRSLAVLLHEERAVRLWRLERLWTALATLSAENPLPPLPDAPALAAVPPP